MDFLCCKSGQKRICKFFVVDFVVWNRFEVLANFAAGPSLVFMRGTTFLWVWPKVKWFEREHI